MLEDLNKSLTLLCILVPVNFLPFGDGDIVNPISDDGSSETIYLQQPFKYFGRTYNQIYVSDRRFFFWLKIFFLLIISLVTYDSAFFFN